MLIRAVNSVLGQTCRSLELIVVDDGSTDGAAEAMAPLAAAGKLRFVRQANRGVSAARNLGLDLARGRLLAFLDSDDYWAPEKCSRQARFMDERPELLICQTEEAWIRAGQRVNPGRKHLKKEGRIFEDSLELCLISPSAVMLRPALLAEVGRFDEDLKAAEDYDLWLRVTARFEVGLLREYLVTRTGGRPDQLSAQPGLDRYRVWALLKLLAGGSLGPAYEARARAVLARRAARYGRGALKRGRAEEGRAYLELAEKAEDQISFSQLDWAGIINPSS